MSPTHPLSFLKVKDAEVASAAQQPSRLARAMVVVHVKTALIRNLIANRAMALCLKSHRVVLLSRKTVESADLIRIFPPQPLAIGQPATIFISSAIPFPQPVEIGRAILSVLLSEARAIFNVVFALTSLRLSYSFRARFIAALLLIQPLPILVPPCLLVFFSLWHGPTIAWAQHQMLPNAP